MRKAARPWKAVPRSEWEDSSKEWEDDTKEANDSRQIGWCKWCKLYLFKYTGARAKAWCLLIHADASLSLSLSHTCLNSALSKFEPRSKASDASWALLGFV